MPACPELQSSVLVATVQIPGIDMDVRLANNLTPASMAGDGTPVMLTAALLSIVEIPVTVSIFPSDENALDVLVPAQILYPVGCWFSSTDNLNYRPCTGTVLKSGTRNRFQFVKEISNIPAVPGIRAGFNSAVTEILQASGRIIKVSWTHISMVITDRPPTRVRARCQVQTSQRPS